MVTILLWSNKILKKHLSSSEFIFENFLWILYHLFQAGLSLIRKTASFSWWWLKIQTYHYSMGAAVKPGLLLSNLLVCWPSDCPWWVNIQTLPSFCRLILTRISNEKTHTFTSRVTAAATGPLHLPASTLNASGCFPRLRTGDIFTFTASLPVRLYARLWEIMITIFPLWPNLQ